MSQFYFDPSRSSDTYALPDGEVFSVEKGEWWYDRNGERMDPPIPPDCCDREMEWSDEHDTFVCSECANRSDEKGEPCEAGWYYWACLPGCLPDSDPYGPYKSRQEAIEAAQSTYAED